MEEMREIFKVSKIALDDPDTADLARRYRTLTNINGALKDAAQDRTRSSPFDEARFNAMRDQLYVVTPYMVSYLKAANAMRLLAYMEAYYRYRMQRVALGEEINWSQVSFEVYQYRVIAQVLTTSDYLKSYDARDEEITERLIRPLLNTVREITNTAYPSVETVAEYYGQLRARIQSLSP